MMKCGWIETHHCALLPKRRHEKIQGERYVKCFSLPNHLTKTLNDQQYAVTASKSRSPMERIWDLKLNDQKKGVWHRLRLSSVSIILLFALATCFRTVIYYPSVSRWSMPMIIHRPITPINPILNTTGSNVKQKENRSLCQVPYQKELELTIDVNSLY